MSSKKTLQLTDSQLKWPHYIYQWLCIETLRLYISLSHKITIHGRENIPKEWIPCIVASNHTSFWDPPLVSAALIYRPIAYMAKIELFEHPFMRLYNWAMSSIPVNREKLELSTVKTVLKVLKHGKWAVGIFPEGTRKQAGAIESPKRGVAYFAKAANVPTLPLCVVFSTRNGKKYVDVRIGTLIPPEDDLDALTLKIQNTIQELIDQTTQSTQ